MYTTSLRKISALLPSIRCPSQLCLALGFFQVRTAGRPANDSQSQHSPYYLWITLLYERRHGLVNTGREHALLQGLYISGLCTAFPNFGIGSNFDHFNPVELERVNKS